MRGMIAAVILLALAGCQTPRHKACVTGFEVRVDVGEQRDSLYGSQIYGSTGVSVYYDLTGEYCGAAR